MSQSRQPRGIPSGGQFSPNSHDEAGNFPVFIDPALIETNAAYDSYPVPQADSLAKLSVAIDAIDSGIGHPETTSEAMGMVPRQGAYYLNAAGYLGIAEQDADGEYHLTELGEEIAQHQGEDRISALSQVVSYAPLVRAVSQDDDVAMADALGDLGDGTSERRIATARVWANASAESDRLTIEYAESYAKQSPGFEEAAKRSREIIRRSREQKRETAPSFCPECFMQLPVTGVCSNCA